MSTVGRLLEPALVERLNQLTLSARSVVEGNTVGRHRAPVKGAMIIGNGPDAMRRVTMIGNDSKLDTGIGMCGKAGQSVPVGVGQPHLRMDQITVGGTKA